MVRKALTKPEVHKFHKHERYTLKVAFRQHQMAYKYSFYPRAEQIDEFTVQYEAKDYFDILRFLLFM
jgi:D-amino peptidase